MATADGVTQEAVLYDVVDGHVAIVTLNRPRVRNAVNAELTRALAAIVQDIEANDDIRVAVLASSNDRVFCAGADLAEIAAGRGPLLVTADGGFAGFAFAPRTKPWIAEIRGQALAGGCELALACDMIVASDDARFGLPEVKRGLYAGAGGVFRLPRRLPRAIALELIATGDPIDVARAHALGLVNRVAPMADLRECTLELARAIAQVPHRRGAGPCAGPREPGRADGGLARMHAGAGPGDRGQCTAFGAREPGHREARRPP